MHVRATFHARLRRVIVKPDILGTSYEASIDGRQVVITLPTTRADVVDPDERRPVEVTAFPDRAEPPLPGGAGTVTTSARLAPSETHAYIDAVRIRVYWEANLPPYDTTVGEDWSKPYVHALHSAAGTARGALERLVAWLRVEGKQPWLALAGEAADFAGSAVLVDLDANLRFPVTLGLSGPTFSLHRSDQILDAERLRTLLAHAAEGRTPPLAESILSDAAFYLFEAAPADAARAVLTAAIACEVKMKQALRVLAAPAAAPVVDLLVAGRGPISARARHLLDKPLLAVAGISLKDDDADLYGGLQRLFSARNEIAHSGAAPDAAAAEEAVAVAANVFRWLRDHGA